MFQSSQPVRVGFSFALPKVPFLLRFNHPNPRGGGSYWSILLLLGLSCCFNHPSPRGLGLLLLHRYRPLSIISIIPPREGGVQLPKVSCSCFSVSIIPTREGWVDIYAHSRLLLSGFNHPTREGWVIGCERSPLIRGFQSSQPARVGSKGWKATVVY